MRVDFALFGEYQTNCYIVSNKKEEIIIDPGKGADEWVLSEVKNPVAIINTHGHFDHVWSNASLQEKLGIPLIIHQDDAFMLSHDPFHFGTPPSKADILIDSDQRMKLGSFEVSFKHFPGHTPGCMTVEIEDAIFTGDFVFKESIGRVDFPFSDPEAMKKSIQKFLALSDDKTLYPGHGTSSTMQKEHTSLKKWLEYL